jgi:hypothetical protein
MARAACKHIRRMAQPPCRTRHCCRQTFCHNAAAGSDLSAISAAARARFVHHWRLAASVREQRLGDRLWLTWRRRQYERWRRKSKTHAFCGAKPCLYAFCVNLPLS